MQWKPEERAARLALGVCALALMSGAAQAATVSGGANGLTWTATSTIVGQTSTGTVATGGNPIYLPNAAKHNGVVTLIMDKGAAGSFICSGSLMGDRRSIVTAGHCVSDGAGTDNPIKTTAYFWDNALGETVPALDPNATAIDVTQYFVHSEYTGEVIDQNDVAVLTLADYAPDFAQDYDLYAEGDLTGEDFNVAGYGRRSNVGGAIGANLGTGRLRQGENRYDFRFGDDAWGGFFDGGPGGFFGEADNEYSYLSDFDNGLAANDASCILASLFGAGGGQFCNTGVGALEAGVAGGDSGGPGFIDGKLASVNSYGLSFTGLGDVDGALNSSWGEFSGYVPTFLHEKFIKTAMVPEPSTWALMIAGFGFAGSSLRRRRESKA